jgi:hypothetical protein
MYRENISIRYKLSSALAHTAMRRAGAQGRTLGAARRLSGGLDQPDGERDERGRDESGACPRELRPGRGRARLTYCHVQEEASRLGENPGDQDAARGPLEPIREVGAGQVEQVDERQHEQDAGVGMARSEEALLPVGQAWAT